MLQNINIIYIMGVSGCGKSTIGEALAKRIKWKFVDGDNFHSMESVEKMSNGVPLTDDDRFPWLKKINLFAKSHNNCVIACSSLKLIYRRILTQDINAQFFLLNLKKDILQNRVSTRPGHFMAPQLLDSQLATLEMPKQDETNVIIVNSDTNVNNIVDIIVGHIFIENK